jgi:hypothetical protein
VRFLDKTRPVVNSFALGTPVAYQVPVTVFTATDPSLASTAPTGIAAYMITESNVIPSKDDTRWSAQVPRIYTATKKGSVDLYPWVKDLTGNVSLAS